MLFLLLLKVYYLSIIILIIIKYSFLFILSSLLLLLIILSFLSSKYVQFPIKTQNFNSTNTIGSDIMHKGKLDDKKYWNMA